MVHQTRGKGRNMKRPLHVLAIPSWYNTPNDPITGSFFKEQFRALQFAGVKVGVLYPHVLSLKYATLNTLRQRHFQITFALEDGLPTYRWHGWKLLPKLTDIDAYWVRGARALIRHYVAQHGLPDVIHAHSALWAGVAVVKNAPPGVPCIVTEHSSIYYEKRATAYMRAATAHSYEASQRVVFCSTHAAQFMIDEGLLTSDKLRIIPNLVYADFFSPPSSHPPREPFRFFAAGFLVPGKRYDMLLRAFAIAFRNDSKVVLDIAGDGPERTHLENLASDLGIASRVTFLGALSREGMRDALHRVHAFAHPSFYETFGVVLIEAMATGLPVVSTACGGPNDIVTPVTGYLSPVDDIEAFAHSLRQIHAAYDEFEPEKIRGYVVKKYSAEAVTKQLLDLYHDVAALTPPPATP
jgi:glycosyltransferase involved in cell wall biosynthesis